MSVRPTASHTRTPLGTGIIAAPARRERVPSRRIDVPIDANPAPARELDLDQPSSFASPATRCAIDCRRIGLGNRRRQRRHIFGDLHRHERRQLRGARHTDYPKLGQPAPLVHLGRQ